MRFSGVRGHWPAPCEGRLGRPVPHQALWGDPPTCPDLGFSWASLVQRLSRQGRPDHAQCLGALALGLGGLGWGGGPCVPGSGEAGSHALFAEGT